MHFCFSGEYTPRAINNIMENPATNRYEAAKKLIEAGGGKLISMYSTSVDGPGVMVIFDVPDPTVAPAISGVVVAAGAMQNVKLVRLFTPDEIKVVRQHASKLKAVYSPPGRGRRRPPTRGADLSEGRGHARAAALPAAPRRDGGRCAPLIRGASTDGH